MGTGFGMAISGVVVTAWFWYVRQDERLRPAEESRYRLYRGRPMGLKRYSSFEEYWPTARRRWRAIFVLGMAIGGLLIVTGFVNIFAAI